MNTRNNLFLFLYSIKIRKFTTEKANEFYLCDEVYPDIIKNRQIYVLNIINTHTKDF